MNPLLSRREGWAWLAAFLVGAALLVLTRFTSQDPDSALYADLAAHLAAGPPSHWIAPEWWGNWEMSGLFREHPAGVFLLPVLLGALGVPAVQASYVVGLAAALASLLLIASLVSKVATREEGRLSLVLLQLMPLAFIFRIRANHEYPMLLCLLVGVVGIDAVRRRWTAVWITPAALTAALLVKGVFVGIPLLAVAFWILINPTAERGSIMRPLAACALSALTMAVVAVVYDTLYLHVTGETFWRPYWLRQLAPLSVAMPVASAEDAAFLPHLQFYLLRVFWHPAPWSLLASAAIWIERRRLRQVWTTLSSTLKRSLLFVLLLASSCILMLSPISRFAERYIFSVQYFIAAAAIVVTQREWPRLRAAVSDLDARIPMLPVIVWIALVLGRIALGDHIPRL